MGKKDKKTDKKTPGSKTIELMQEKAREEKGTERKERIELTEEEKDRIETVAYALSRKWRYHKLMMAANIETARIEGREVHGYMARMFPDYEWLFQNDVLDLACYFAMRDYHPEVFNIVKHYDFEHAIINVIPLPEKINFDIYPEFDFDLMIVLTQKEPFENAVHWIENQPWTDEDGYDTTVTLSPSNFLNAGFTLWDLPVLILKDTVGKDRLFFEAKTTAKELVDIQEQLLKKHIYTKRQEESTMIEKVGELEERYEQLEERHQYLKDEIRAGDTTNAEEKLKKFEKRFDTRHYYASKIDYKTIIIGLVILVLIIFLIYGIILIITPPQSASTEIPEYAGLLLNTFKRGS